MKDCLFCKIVSGNEDAFIWYEDEQVMAFLDIHPLFEGHTLLIPKKHVSNFHELDSSLSKIFFEKAKNLADKIKYNLECEGTFIAMNNIVSQSVPHLHLHIVPRNKGDGLKGFFWPRKKFTMQRMEEIRKRLSEESDIAQELNESSE